MSPPSADSRRETQLPLAAALPPAAALPLAAALPPAAAEHEAQYLAHGLAAQRAWPDESFIRFLGRFFSHMPPAERAAVRILDVGCGTGRNLWPIAKEGMSAFGFDGSPAALALTRAHLQAKWGVSAELAQGTFTAIPFGDGFFDAVCDSHSLQHATLEESHLALKEIHRVLKPGGRFYSFRLSERACMWADGGGNKLDEATIDAIRNPAVPLNIDAVTSFWSPEIARREYARAGLRVLEIERVGRTRNGCAQWVEYLEVTADKPQDEGSR